MQSELLNTQEAAKYLKVSKAFLERDRCYTARIPFIKVGTRAVRYRLHDLNIYLESQIRKSTSDTGGAS
jgi:excisionase family DNA binding protein